jgi:outer membrane protein assembly factor BamB
MGPLVPRWRAPLDDAALPPLGVRLIASEDSLIHLTRLRSDRFSPSDGSVMSTVTATDATASRSIQDVSGETRIFTFESWRAVPFEAWLIGISQGDEIAAFDPRSGALVWTSNVDAVSHLASARDRVVFGGTVDDELVLGALESATGRLAWQSRTAIHAVVARVLGDGGDCALVAFVPDGSAGSASCVTRLLDTRDGATVWERAEATAASSARCTISIDGETAAVRHGETGYSLLRIVDGSVLATVPSTETEREQDFVLADDSIFALSTRGSGRYGDEAPLVAMDAASGAVRWRAEPRAVAITPQVIGPWIVVHGRDTALRAYERDTGALAWTYHVGEDATVVLAPPSAPRWLVVATAIDLRGFDLASPAMSEAPSPTVVIGRLATERGSRAVDLSGISVRVGDVEVRSGTRGRFRAEVVGVGTAAIEVRSEELHLDERAPGQCGGSTAPPTVPLDGLVHHVTVPITFGACD